MVLFQQVDFFMGVHIYILLITTIVMNWTIYLILLLNTVDFQGYLS